MNGKLIYLLEDDADIQDQLRMLLSRKGYRVAGFSTVKAFTEQIGSTVPELCILDVNLPDGNGLDVFSSMHTAPVTAQIPVLLMSANFHAPAVTTYPARWHFIAKPFKVREFLDTVDKLIEK